MNNRTSEKGSGNDRHSTEANTAPRHDHSPFISSPLFYGAMSFPCMSLASRRMTVLLDTVVSHLPRIIALFMYPLVSQSCSPVLLPMVMLLTCINALGWTGL